MPLSPMAFTQVPVGRSAAPPSPRLPPSPPGVPVVRPFGLLVAPTPGPCRGFGVPYSEPYSYSGRTHTHRTGPDRYQPPLRGYSFPAPPETRPGWEPGFKISVRVETRVVGLEQELPVFVYECVAISSPPPAARRRIRPPAADLAAPADLAGSDDGEGSPDMLSHAYEVRLIHPFFQAGLGQSHTGTINT